MRHQWIFAAALSVPLALSAQSDTVHIFRPAQQPDRIEVRERSTISHYTDTLISVVSSPDSTAQQREEVIYADSTDRKGHYIQAYAGFGGGGTGYHLNTPANHSGEVSSVNGSFSALLQIQYAYFFHPNWGVGAGLWFTNYTSHAHLRGNYLWADQTDTDLELHYDHTASVTRWRERETIHTIGIPVSLQFQYKKDDWKARIFASAGVAPAFPVSKKYHVLSGEIEHSGYYPAWDLTLDKMHEFGTKRYENEPSAKGQMAVRPQVAVFADFGALLPLTEQIELFLGGYFNVAANDANGSERHPVGWKDETFSFMDPYEGAYATDMASASHPWEAGVKIGIQWHHIAAPKHNMIDYYDYFTRVDTTVTTLARQDTVITEQEEPVIPAHIQEAADEVEKFNKIYFGYDSYVLTKEAKKYLSSIVSVLNRVPDAMITIDGHASSEGLRSHNEWLAFNRANAVANYLINQGVEYDRVFVTGHGSLVPNEENVNHELPLDRRAEVKVVQKQSEKQ